MATEDPQYVRLASRLTSGTQVDLNTGWSISGMDVKPFPKENSEAARFVRSRMNRSILEPATEQQYNFVQEANEAVGMVDEARRVANAAGTLSKALGLKSPTQGIQEAQVRAEATKARRALEAAHRGEEVDADRERRAALIAQNRASTGAPVSEDVEEDDEPNGGALVDLTNAELRSRLENLGLETGGNKPVLIARLEAAGEGA